MQSEKKGREKISVSDLILFLLEKGVRGGELFFESTIELRDWIYEFNRNYPRDKINNFSLSQAIRRLRTRGLIERENKKAEKIIIRLTQAGKDFVFFKKGEKDLNWDGRWRIVIFDIPESKRLIRNVLRRKLKSWGFVRWQKSVWASKKNLTKQLRSIIKELKIGDWVLVLESDNVEF